jgi:hypothetical protein
MRSIFAVGDSGARGTKLQLECAPGRDWRAGPAAAACAGQGEATISSVALSKRRSRRFSSGGEWRVDRGRLERPRRAARGRWREIMVGSED